jgi:hypothetical protein
MFSPSLKHKGLMIEINNWQGRKIINELYDSTTDIYRRQLSYWSCITSSESFQKLDTV